MYNPYYNYPGNNFTFHPNIPPPPCPPKFFIPLNPVLCQESNDQDFIKQFERSEPLECHKVKPELKISQVFEKLQNIVIAVNKLKTENEFLIENILISDEEWDKRLGDIEENKEKVNKTLEQINNININEVKPLLAKRRAKRLRLKRVCMERKLEKEKKLKEMQERSRKIDEQLQKIKDEIIKAKQEEESKIQADIILKEVLRKKHDAKKCIVKLDAFLKLRKARGNTRKSRGEAVSEIEAASFNSNIAKLKSLWTQKLASYEKEESELRTKLAQDTENTNILSKGMDNVVIKNLEEWRVALFGGIMPQVDFKADIARFIAVRSQWDQFINNEGSTMPIGWVSPSSRNADKSM